MSKINQVWVVSDSADRYADLLAGAKQFGEHVSAVIWDESEALQVQHADAVYVLSGKSEQQRLENYAETLAALIQNTEKDDSALRTGTLILLAATRRGKSLAAKLSILLQSALINDATSLALENGELYAEHRMYGGLAFGREKINTPTAIVTVSSGVFEPLEANAPHQLAPMPVSYIPPQHELLCKARRAKSVSSIDLSKARRVVGIGRGLAAKDDLHMIWDLAAALNAEVGCSRPIAEGEHWMDRERYIGVSGVLLKTDVYLALGISGQIQHMVGGNGAKTIVAINKDKNAPIFQYADYGLVGDIYKVVPALTELLQH